MSEFKIYIQNNYLIIECDDPAYVKQTLAKDVLIQPVDSTNPVEFEFYNFDNQKTKWATIALADMVDEIDTPYDYNTWTEFYTANTGSGSVSADITLSNIETLLNTLVDTQNTGSVTTEIIAPALPYTIADDIYNSFTVITTGVVSIGGVSVVAGSYTFSCGSNETLTGQEITTPGGGTVVILTQQKA